VWIKPSRIYASPASHVGEFLRILTPDSAVESVIEFTDRSMGSLMGRSYRETLGEFPRRNWLAWQRSFWVAPPDGESFFDISERVLTAFRTRVLPVRADETVMIVAPDDVLRLIIGYVTKVEEEGVPKIKIESMVPYVINGSVEVPA
jgi:2,3-bisphosphoglycerate-dependent phosphoglycerate mutase